MPKKEKENTNCKEKKEVQKEQFTNYLYPKITIEPENQGWMHVKFFLIENNWHFANFEFDMKAKDPIFYALRKIELRHGKIKYEFTDMVGEIYKTQGEMKKSDAKTFNLYYEFDVDIKSPLLLYEMS